MAIQLRKPGKIATSTIQTDEQGLNAAKTALSDLTSADRSAQLRRQALEDIAAQKNVQDQQFDQRARQTGAARTGLRASATPSLLAQNRASGEARQMDLQDKTTAAGLGLQLAGQETARSAQQAQLQTQASMANEQNAQQASAQQGQLSLDERKLDAQTDQFAQSLGIQKDQLDFGKQMSLREATRADEQVKLAQQASERDWQTLALNKTIANNQNILGLRSLDQNQQQFDQSFKNDIAKLQFSNNAQKDLLGLQNKYQTAQQQFQNAFNLQIEGLRDGYARGQIQVQGEQQRALQDYMDKIAQRQEDRNRGWNMLGSLVGVAGTVAGAYITGGASVAAAKAGAAAKIATGAAKLS